MRLVALAFVICLYSENCLATSIIAIRTDETFVIAADSKVTNINGPPSLICKIVAAPNEVIGAAGFEGHGTFDVIATAKSTLGAPGYAASRIASFESEMRRELPSILAEMHRVQPQQYETLVRHHLFIQVGFGIAEENEIKATYMAFTADNPDTISIVKKTCPGECAPGIAVDMILGEERAIDAELARDPGIIDRLGRVAALNRLLGLQAEATPLYVGRPISIASLSRDGHVQWDQAGYCQQ